MFNLKSLEDNKNDLDNDSLILKNELEHLDVFLEDSVITAKVGDVVQTFHKPEDCLFAINELINEIKQDLWKHWKSLGDISLLICSNESLNSSNLSNLLFLTYLKRSFLLSKQFKELKNISEQIHKVFYRDIVDVSNNIIQKFNDIYLKISVLHNLILKESYKKKVLNKYFTLNKQAQVSGPWANLDLPMSERMWSGAEDEEYFEGRTSARRNQLRYNPSYNKQGFAYVWQDVSTHPYSFDKRDEDSPYKSLSQFSIP